MTVSAEFELEELEVSHKAIRNQSKFCQAEITAFVNLITKQKISENFILQ